MREQLIRMDDIPPTGTVTVDLLGREVLVMLLNGKPRAYVNVCMHHGGPLRLEGDTFTCEWRGRPSRHGPAGRSRAPCGRMRG
jgi:nitrite reductase/ring-hydroxylating ferredoxin subunit